MRNVSDCVEVVLFYPCKKWVCHYGGGCSGMTLTSLCVFWCCLGCVELVGIVCGLPVGFQLSVKNSWRMDVLEEQNGTVVCVSWPLRSGLASGPLSILNTLFQF